MPPRQPGRIPFLFFPLMLLWGLTLWMALSGPGPMNPLGNWFASPGERLQASQDALDQAVTVTGDPARVDAALASAVAYLTPLVSTPSQAYIEVGGEMTRRGHPVETVRLLQKATQDSALADDPMLWATLADARRHAGSADKAKEDEDQADRRAAAILTTINQRSPGSSTPADIAAVLRFLQAGTYYGSDTRNNIPDALRAYREALRLTTEKNELRALALNDLGYLLADKGKTPAEYTEALTLTRQALDLQPDEPSILDSYGWALYRTGDAENARRVLSDAADNAPDLPEIHLHLAQVYDSLHLPDDARIEVARVLIMDPENKTALALKARLAPR